MPDLLRIKALRVRTRIGWEAHEREEPREILINVDLETDTSAAGTSDDLADTVDYHSAIVVVAELVRGSEFRLLEHVAEQIATVLTNLEGVSGVSVEVEKEDPPIDEDIRAAAVRIHRSADGG